jgi:hypothetical protein
MRSSYYFNKYIIAEYLKYHIPETVSDLELLYSDDPQDFKILTKQERHDKIQYMNSTVIQITNDPKTIKSYLMNYTYTCDTKIINPIFEIRLKYLKYRELDTDEEKSVFYEAQHKYQILYRFINKIKFNKMRKFDNECDLCMVPFSSLLAKQTIWLFENGFRFQFNVRDLLNIVISSLSSCFYMFETAKLPKNPFTNTKLTLFQLHLIYIRLCEMKIKIPLIFELFYKSNFILKKFKRDNSRFLAICAIETHYRKDVVATKERVIDVLEMINDFCNPFMKIRFHKHFPMQKIYDVFRPYLILRTKWVAFQCFDSKEKLENGLKIFNMYNPMFGHKYFVNGSAGFDDRHISFGDLFNSKFYDENTQSMIEVANHNKNKYGSLFCTGLRPIDDVQYVLMKSYENQFPEYEPQPQVVQEEEEEPQVVQEEEEEEEEDEDDDDEEHEDEDEDDEDEEQDDEGDYDP